MFGDVSGENDVPEMRFRGVFELVCDAMAFPRTARYGRNGEAVDSPVLVDIIVVLVRILDLVGGHDSSRACGAGARSRWSLWAQGWLVQWS